MTNPATFRPADDLEAAASLEADLEEARKAASLLAEPDIFVAVAALLRAAEQALAGGSLPWTALEAAHSGICDLRCEHGCEEWPHVSDWTVQAMAVEFLWEEERRLRGLARQQRDAAPAELRKAG